MSKSNISLEVWATRYGVSVRVVQRKDDGRFVDHLSVKQLSQIQKHLESQNYNDVKRVLNVR